MADSPLLRADFFRMVFFMLGLDPLHLLVLSHLDLGMGSDKD